MWEKRYDLFSFARSHREQRIYSDDELKKLLRLAFLYHNGWTITNLMALPDDKIKSEVKHIAVSNLNYQTFILHLVHAAADLNEAAFMEALNGLIQVVGVEKTIIEVCYPYLLRLDVLWTRTKAVSAQERFSSYLIQSTLLNETTAFSSLQNEPPELVLFSPEKEGNDLPLLFLNYLLRKAGWKVFYLGGNNSLADLKRAASLPSIFYLYLHLPENTAGIFIDDYLATLRQTFPGKIIFASGKGIEQNQRRFLRVYLLRNDEAIYRMIASKKELARTLPY